MHKKNNPWTMYVVCYVVILQETIHASNLNLLIAVRYHDDHSWLWEFHSDVHCIRRSWHQSTWFKYRENHCSRTGCIMFNLTWTILPFHIIPYMTLAPSIQKKKRTGWNSMCKYCVWNASRNSFPIAASLLNSYISTEYFLFNFIRRIYQGKQGKCVLNTVSLLGINHQSQNLSAWILCHCNKTHT